MSNASPPTRSRAMAGPLPRRKRVSLNPARWTHIHLLRTNAHFSAASTHTPNPPPLSDAETTVILHPIAANSPFPNNTLANLNFAARLFDEGHNPARYLRHLLNHFFYYPGCNEGPIPLHVKYENQKAKWRPIFDAPHKGIWAVGPEKSKSHMAEEVACFVVIMLASEEKPVAPLLFTIRRDKVLLLRSRRNEGYLNRLMAGKLQKEDELVVETLAVWNLNFLEQRLELAKVAAALARSEDIFGF